MFKERTYSDYIQDILTSISDINKITEDKTYKDFIENISFYRAIERTFEIIGEAANRIPKEIQDNYPDIPWAEMISMRNRIIHAYDRVNPEVLWDTINADLPELIIPLNNVLQDLLKKEAS